MVFHSIVLSFIKTIYNSHERHSLAFILFHEIHYFIYFITQLQLHCYFKFRNFFLKFILISYMTFPSHFLNVYIKTFSLDYEFVSTSKNIETEIEKMILK